MGSYSMKGIFFLYLFIPSSAFGAFVRVWGTCYGKETSPFCQAQNFEASFLCTAHCITSACSFNIGLALLLGIRSLDPRSRTRTAPALTWCRRQLGSQTSCSTKSRSQYWSLTFLDIERLVFMIFHIAEAFLSAQPNIHQSKFRCWNLSKIGMSS